jgi:hypothetical protein
MPACGGLTAAKGTDFPSQTLEPSTHGNMSTNEESVNLF